jgi:hypothetical protein
MRMSTVSLSTEAYTGSAMEDALAALALSENAAEAELEHAALVSVDAGVAPQSSEDLYAALSEYSTSEHAVFCNFVENAVAQAVALVGHVAAGHVWSAAIGVLHARSAVLLEGEDGAAERAALDVHVATRLACRCAHCLDVTCPEKMISYSETMMNWAAQVMERLERGSLSPTRQRPLMITGSPF